MVVGVIGAGTMGSGIAQAFAQVDGFEVRLCDINHPLWDRFLFVVLFTFVKSVKYLSFKPFGYFVSICRLLSRIRAHRRACICGQ